MAYIELDDVYFAYDKKNPVIGGLDLEIPGNGVTAVTGPNGSGKTTLGKLIMGVLRPDSGKITIDGRDGGSMSLGEIGSKIGYLFQNPELQIFSSQVIDELTFIPLLRGADEASAYRQADLILEKLHLQDKRDSMTFNLSYGEKQRLAIAGILMNRPAYLILDEPTTGLDMVRKELLAEILRGLLSEGTGMAIISHDLKFIDNFPGCVVNMGKDAKVETGT